MKLQLGGEYGRVLRVIGQDLQSLFPESFQILVKGKDLIAWGYCRSEVSRSGATQERSSLGKIWQKLRQPALNVQSKSDQPSLARFERVYTPTDINQLDEAQRSRRTDSPRQDSGCKPELHSLQEKLRIIGRFVDEQRCELVKIAWNANTISFEYRNGDGELRYEEHSTLALYKLQQQYSSNRSTAVKDPWM